MIKDEDNVRALALTKKRDRFLLLTDIFRQYNKRIHQQLALTYPNSIAENAERYRVQDLGKDTRMPQTVGKYLPSDNTVAHSLFTIEYALFVLISLLPPTVTTI